MKTRQMVKALRDEMRMRGVDNVTDKEIEDSLFSKVALAEMTDHILTYLRAPKEKAYEMGLRTAEAGVIRDNPFPTDSAESKEWSRGYRVGAGLEKAA